MSRLKKALRVARCLGLVLVALGLLVILNIGRLVNYAMTPGVAFDAQPPPAAPDYADQASWSALPERDDLADRAPDGHPAVDQLRADVDVFYVHPTSYVGSRWNAPADDPEINAATDRVATGIQASAFNACCAIYAPRYRQANGMAFVHPSADGDRSIAVAFEDVSRAFDAFNTRRRQNRPFIIAAHSQGAILAERLLYEAVAGKPLREQLVAAYLIGGGITVGGLHERAPDIPVCRAADDIHCVAAWNARGPTHVPTEFELHIADTRERACTNPLSWEPSGAHAPSDLNLGAVFLETDNHAPRVAFADAQCTRGMLVVRHIDSAPRDLPSKILDHVMGSENYHAIEIQMYFLNLRSNAATRAAAFMRQSKAGSAPL